MTFFSSLTEKLSLSSSLIGKKTSFTNLVSFFQFIISALSFLLHLTTSMSLFIFSIKKSLIYEKFYKVHEKFKGSIGYLISCVYYRVWVHTEYKGLYSRVQVETLIPCIIQGKIQIMLHILPIMYLSPLVTTSYNCLKLGFVFSK